MGWLDIQLERQNLFCINELSAEKKYAKDYVFHTISHLKQNKQKINNPPHIYHTKIIMQFQQEKFSTIINLYTQVYANTAHDESGTSLRKGRIEKEKKPQQAYIH